MLSSQNISKQLLDVNIKPSIQRMKIFEYLLKNNIHPTVDIVYNNLANDIPTLSKTTIYNTLKLFEKTGLIKSVNIEENEIRYDAKKDIHGHFKCNECGKIYDFDYNYDDLKYKGLKDFVFNQADIMIKGICKSCASKNKILIK